jgi:hypothetical protein
MGCFYRVFGRRDAAPAAEAILAHLGGRGLAVAGRFDGAGEGWFSAELAFGEGAPAHLERFLASEEGIRAELNSWAAYLETCDDSPQHLGLMERVIQSRQLFTLRRPSDHAGAGCVEVCRFLAAATDGFYQADGEGFFEADGGLLVREP